MCRNIRPLFNFQPPVTEQEIRDAALQYVRKISGTRNPSQSNRVAFEQAVERIYEVSADLLSSMTTTAPPKDRDTEIRKARERRARSLLRPISGRS